MERIERPKKGEDKDSGAGLKPATPIPPHPLRPEWVGMAGARGVLGVRDPEPHTVSHKIFRGGGGDNRAQRRQDSRIWLWEPLRVE